MMTRFFCLALAFVVLNAIAVGDDAPGDDAPAPSVILGTCQSQTGQPIEGATVTLYHSGNRLGKVSVVQTVSTDDAGSFQLAPQMLVWGEDEESRYLITFTAEGHSSLKKRVDPQRQEGSFEITLHSKPATLIGHVTDPNGKPVAGAAVFVPDGFHNDAVVDVLMATTDEKGVFRITDMEPWRPDEPGRMTRTLLIDHPDYARTRSSFESVPQVLRIQMVEPAIVTGQVVDQVTHKPAANIVVSAQGVAESGWFQTRTDGSGKYELRMRPDRYNIWAEMPNRIAVAVDSIKAITGKTATGADIKMVKGAIVYGQLKGVGGKEAPVGHLRVAHYGPARPRSGAAVTSTLVRSDGSYRLRVAPGHNYLYMMSGGGSIDVDVDDGEEYRADITPGDRVDLRKDKAGDPDPQLRAAALLEQQLREAIEQSIPSRDRGDTKVGKLLDRLEALGERNFAFKDAWLQTLHDLVKCGPDAVPELIAELDATEANVTLRAMGFVLRAIGDRRAVPALIRSIPRVYLTHGSDLGRIVNDAELAVFAQKHDLSDNDQPNRYSLGRPIREVFGAIHVLTGHDFDDAQIYSIRPTGTAGQRELKREMVQRHAAKWAGWWEANAAKLNVPEAWQKVNLPPVEPAKIVPVELGIDYQTTANRSNSMLEPVQAGKTYMSFLDLDTGRKGNLPKRWQEFEKNDLPLDEIAAWGRGEGFDLMGTEFKIDDGKRCFAIRLLGARAIQLPENHWKKRFKQIRLEELAERGIPIKGDYLFQNDGDEADHLGHATFFIVTAEESPVLFFLGIEVNDDSLKPGGIANGDNELKPVAFRKGRRFGMSLFEPVDQPDEKLPPGAGAKEKIPPRAGGIF